MSEANVEPTGTATEPTQEAPAQESSEPTTEPVEQKVEIDYNKIIEEALNRHKEQTVAKEEELVQKAKEGMIDVKTHEQQIKDAVEAVMKAQDEKHTNEIRALKEQITTQKGEKMVPKAEKSPAQEAEDYRAKYRDPNVSLDEKIDLLMEAQKKPSW